MTSSKGRKGPGRLALALVALGAVVAAGWYALSSLGWLGGDTQTALEGATVRRGPLSVRVVEKGNLESADSVVLKNEIEGTTTILSLIPEGTQVRAGDVLCELDVSESIDDRVQQEISVRNAESAYVKAEKQYEIQVIQNESDVARAEQDLQFAKQDLDKFEEADRALSEQEAREAITLAEEEFERAKDKLAWSDRLAEKGFLTQTELEADGLALTRSEILLEQRKRQLQTLLDFEFPRELAQLQSDVREAERELARVKLQADARLVDFEKARDTNLAKLELEREKLAKIVSQIEKGTLVAPRAGMVVYAKDDSRGRWGSQDPIAEGTQVRERQAIITIPSTSGMIAEASIHESVIEQVKIGQDCTVRIDAIGGREYRGRVAFVALLPDSNSWWANPNTRLYRTTIEIDEQDSEMRPGMSCSIEVRVDDLEDAVHVPVQCVYRHGGENICFVPAGGTIEERTVAVGANNDVWVQILSGLTEGETVLLSPPPGFAPDAERPRDGERRDPERGAPGGGERRAGPATAAAERPRGESAGGRPRAEAGAQGKGGAPEHRGADERKGADTPAVESAPAVRRTPGGRESGRR